jgi:hypothetical protein
MLTEQSLATALAILNDWPFSWLPHDHMSNLLRIQ